jgi:hypothetical protein
MVARDVPSRIVSFKDANGYFASRDGKLFFVKNYDGCRKVLKILENGRKFPVNLSRIGILPDSPVWVFDSCTWEKGAVNWVVSTKKRRVKNDSVKTDGHKGRTGRGS